MIEKNSYDYIADKVRTYWKNTFPQDVVAFFWQKYSCDDEWEHHEEVIFCKGVSDYKTIEFLNDFCEGQTCVKDITVVPLSEVTKYYARMKLEETKIIEQKLTESPKYIPMVYYDQIMDALKEHETKHPVCEKCGKKIDHIITSVFNDDGSESEYSFPITYNKDNGSIQFSITTQKWTGFELSDTEQKESIRCPFCCKFPFNANEKIEFYEPEEVVVMMRESQQSENGFENEFEEQKTRGSWKFVCYNPSYSPFDGSPSKLHRCTNCGYMTGSTTKYCPVCGSKNQP